MPWLPWSSVPRGLGALSQLLSVLGYFVNELLVQILQIVGIVQTTVGAVGVDGQASVAIASTIRGRVVQDGVSCGRVDSEASDSSS